MLTYSTHARTMLTERGIDPAWVERTVAQPDTVEPDPAHPDRMRAFRAARERDGRVLRVVDARTDDAIRVITVFLDRGTEAGAMKASYDAETDALYLRLADAPVAESEEVRPGIVLDYDATGRLVAIEVLDAREHLASGSDLAKLAAA